MLIHLIDATQDDVVGAYKTIQAELKAYGEGLIDKPQILVLNKADALDEETRKEKVKALKKAAKTTPYLISGVSGEGVIPLLRTVFGRIVEGRAQAKLEANGPPDESWRP